MEWMTTYGPEKQPTETEISSFIDDPMWEDLNKFVQDSYQVSPAYSYSQCAGQPGWNVKYKKAGRSLCTLYPMDGFFIALVVIGTKEREEAELLKPSLSKHVQKLMETADISAMGQWLMVNVTDEEILDNVKWLIQLRRKIK